MTSLYTESYGQGKPLVMVHGWGMHTGIWRPFAKALSSRFRVLCIDLPGHGRSARIPVFDLDHIAPLLAAAGEEPACWLGWSLGATAVLDLAARYPGRVERLILLAGNPHFTRSPDAADHRAHWPGVSPRVLEAFAHQLAEDAQQTLLRFLALQVHGQPDTKDLLKTLKTAVLECPPPDPDTLAQGLEILKQADLRPALSAFQGPAAALLGERDTLVPHALGEALKRLRPDLALFRLDKAGHVPFLTHEAELVESITRFMEPA